MNRIEPGRARSWPELRERLAELERLLGETQQPDAQQARGILQQRARQLASTRQEEDVGETLTLLVFELAGEIYALEPQQVDAVLPLRHLTPIPGTPAFVAGIISVRGHLKSVVDLRQLFELPARVLSERNSVILLSSSQMELGLLCDRVIGLRTLPRSAVLPPPVHLNGTRHELLFGVTTEHWALLDVEALLRDPRLVVSDSV